MENININLNEILERKQIEKDILDILNNFYTDTLKKKGIYLYGDDGIGKTTFILNLLKQNDYDIIHYDNSSIRNKTLIEYFEESVLENKNICYVKNNNIFKL